MSNHPRTGSREHTAQLIEQAMGCSFVVAAQLSIEMTEAESETINRSARNFRHIEQLVTRIRERIGQTDAEINFAEKATESGERKAESGEQGATDSASDVSTDESKVDKKADKKADKKPAKNTDKPKDSAE